MLKNYLFLVSFIYFNCLSFSQVKTIDTIYSNTNNKVLLIFKDNITRAMLGNNEFHFGYGKENVSEIGYLTCMENATPTNLFITTENNGIYNFIVSYKKELNANEMVYNLGNKENINAPKVNLKVTPGIRSNTTKQVSNTTDNNDYDYNLKDNIKNNYKLVCKEILKDNISFFKNHFTIIDKVFFRLKGYYYHNDELYFYLEIDNQSAVDFDINFIKFLTTTKRIKDKKLSQQIFLGDNGSPIYSENFKNRITAKTKNSFVFVYNKFTLNNKKALHIELSELKGERILALELLSKLVNKPKSI